MIRRIALALALVAALAGCRTRTYVLVTVDVDPSISADVAELRFVSRLRIGTEVIDTDEQRFGGGTSKLSLPDSFIILADDRGGHGEDLEIFVEAFDASGAAIARGRGATYIVSNKESTTQIVLRGICVEIDDCLGGRAFCDAPQSCECEGEECLEGFCAPIPLDDGNTCTEAQCDEPTRVVTQALAPDGQSCATSDGSLETCAQGVCKAPACGDFIVDLGEECDDGLLNSDTAPLSCRSDCTAPRCGDGVLDEGIAFGRIYSEECDDPDGNSSVDPDACREVQLDDGSIACRLAFCGDGVVDSGERCDDASVTGADGCNPTCNLLGEVSLIAGGLGGSGNADGVGAGARLRDLFAIAVDGDLAYVTADEQHGGGEDHTLRTIDLSSGEVTTVAGARGQAGHADDVGAAARLDRPRGLALVGQTLYVADSGNHQLRAFDVITGELSTVAGTGEPGHVDGALAAARFAQPRFVIARSPTELIVYDSLPSTGCRLRKVDLGAGVVSTLAGREFCIFPFDGSGADAAFGEVSGMVLAEPYLYVADSNSIRRVDLDASPAIVTTLAGGTSPGFVDGVGAAARFNVLGGMVLDDGDLYIADAGNHALRHLDLDTFAVTSVAVDGGVSLPRTLARAGDTLLVAESASHTLLALDLATAPPLPALAVAGRASRRGLVDGVGAAARFDGPGGLALIGDPDLFVADERNGAIRRLDLATGVVSTLDAVPPSTLAWAIDGDSGRLFAVFDQGIDQVLRELDPATGQPIGLPGQPIALDAPSVRGLAILGNHAYVTALSQSVIRRVDLTTGELELFAGAPNIQGIADGPASLALFGAPAGIVACGGNLYVAESEDTFRAHVIRMIDFSTSPDPMVTTLAGVPGVPGYLDGPGTTALFDEPVGLACDGASLYVTEAGNHLVRQVELATGRVTTLAGQAHVIGAIDGVGDAAAFSRPKGIVYDPSTGDLFVTDQGENVIRRVR